MRFAYIDSQGNEVTIPSVDALALRIELGAIGPDTQLYDAQADRWGPAQTHEIFHTLSRGVSDEGAGFVAPPPPVAPPPEPGEADARSAGAPPPPSEPPATGPEEELNLDFTLTEPPGSPEGAGPAASPDAPASAEPPSTSTSPSGGERDLDLEFTLTPDPEAPAPGTPPPTEEPAARPGEPAGPTEAGDETQAAAEEPLARPEEPAASAPEPAVPAPEPAVPAPGPAEPAPGPAEPLERDTPTADETSDTGPFDFGGGLDLEPSLADDLHHAGAPPAPEPPPPDDDDVMDFSGMGGAMDLELEQPLSEFTSDAPPSWMEQEGPSMAGEADDVMDFSRPSADDLMPPVPPRAGDDDRPPPPRRERPEPRSRPSPPRRPKKSPVGAILGTVVLLAVVVGGGYMGWQALQSRRPSPDDAVAQLPKVTIPDIPQELMPTMRTLGDRALSRMVARFRTREAGLDLPAEPRSDWLAGVYLANASQFPDIQAYWEGIGSFVDLVRDNDTQVFHDQYAALLDSAGISGERAALLQARADSGFLSTRADRFEAYALMDDLVRAALDLHRFLLDNEANIAYEPAAGGVSRDPVLEAVPNSEELGNQMWGMVDRITEALDALGTLDRVTTDRLTTVLLNQVRKAGFQ